eukprot:365464-Chlamydomonas_euryale.AAC.6
MFDTRRRVGLRDVVEEGEREGRREGGGTADAVEAAGGDSTPASQACRCGTIGAPCRTAAYSVPAAAGEKAEGAGAAERAGRMAGLRGRGEARRRAAGRAGAGLRY